MRIGSGFVGLAVWFAAAAAHAAHPAAPPPAWSGVWRGALGPSQIVACFGTFADPNDGAYYYLRHGEVIPLASQSANGRITGWTEDSRSKDPPRWVLSASAETLNGSWSQGAQTLPIRLTRLAPSPDRRTSEPCGDLAFQTPRLGKLALVRKPARRDGVDYTRLIADQQKTLDLLFETFQLPGASAAVALVNAQLMKALPATLGGADKDYLDCLAGGVESNGMSGGYSVAQSPEMITRRWLVVQISTEEYCGGPHPNSASTSQLYSLETGAAVDPLTWFTPAYVHVGKQGGYDVADIQPLLTAILKSRWPRNDKDCAEVADMEVGWSARPTRDGLALTPGLPRVVQACTDDVVLSYGELGPMLNAAGKAAIASLQTDIRALPPKPKSKG